MVEGSNPSGATNNSALYANWKMRKLSKSFGSGFEFLGGYQIQPHVAEVVFETIHRSGA